jgi:2-methylcitrate dehydratase PrpD
MDDQMNVSERLARFISEARWSDVPDEVRHEAKRALINGFATALAGCRENAVEIALRVLSPLAGDRNATIIGRAERTDVPTAAFLNAASANVLDFDDTHLPTVIHPTAPVAPALFALAELRPISGAELLHAFVLGVEIECRLGNAIHPAHYRRGWHITSTCGVFGAAVATGKLLGLDPRHMVWAFGNASTQSSGLVETLGTDAKSFGVGHSARAGLLSALLAEQGFAGPEQPLEGPRGFLAVMGENPDLAALTDGLGESWQIQRNTYKPYPCGVVLAPVIDACLALLAQGVAPARIRSVRVSGHPLLRERTDRPDVESGRLAQVSAQHSVAVALLTGAAGLAQFTDAAVRDPAVRGLRDKVQVIEDAAIPVGAARVELVLDDGRSLSEFVAHARGSVERPLSDAELEQKLIALAASGCPGLDVKPLIAALWSLDRAETATQPLRLAVPPGKGAGR